MDTEQLIKLLCNYFDSRDDISTVYLFGSQAKGKARVASDIDLAILFFNEFDVYKRFDLKLEIASDLELITQSHVDIVSLEDADPYFVHQVLLTMRVIVDKDIQRRVSFEVKHRRVFFDMQPFYNLYHEQSLQRLEGK